jgi:hypothetical protein
LRSHYDVLDVETGADLDSIKRAWHAKVRLSHPDVHAGSDEAARAAALNETRRINDAWETLRDPARRRLYDLQLGQRIDAATRTGAQVASVLVTCAGCQATQPVSGGAERYICARCKTVWRFTRCDRCHVHGDVKERWGKWGCESCGQVHDSYWGGTIKRIRCVRCRQSTEVALGAPTFRCTGCQREYLRCACNAYTSFSVLVGRRWRCRSCKHWNVRVADETAHARSIQRFLDARDIDAPGAADALAGRIRPGLDGVARVGAGGEEGVVVVAGSDAAVWWRDGRGVQSLDLRSFDKVLREGRLVTLRSPTGARFQVLASSDKYADGWVTHMTALGATSAQSLPAGRTESRKYF